MQETWVRSLGAWEIPQTEETGNSQPSLGRLVDTSFGFLLHHRRAFSEEPPLFKGHSSLNLGPLQYGAAQVVQLVKSLHATGGDIRLEFHPCEGTRRKWQPTPVFLPGESHGQRSLVSIESTVYMSTVHGVANSHTRLK